MANSRPPRRPSDRSPRTRGTGPAGGRDHLKSATPWGAIAFFGVVTLVITLVAAGAIAFAVFRLSSDDTESGAVQEFADLKREHTTAAVRYPQSPPVGGPHDPVWQNCGVYDTAVRDENAVHSMEHGAVWITYRPDLPADQVAELRRRAEADDHILMSPYPALDRPVALSAWGRQLKVQSAGDERVDEFLRDYVRGPQTPEPGAPCTGGKSTP